MAEESHKKDGLCSLTAQKLTDDKIFTEAPGRNHPGYSAEDYCESERIEPHRTKIPYPDDNNLKKLTKDIKFNQKSGAQLKNNEYGKIWTNIQNKRDDNNSNNMDEDLATKLKERSKKVEEPNADDDLPPPPAFAQVQLRKTGSRELLNVE